MRAHRAILMSSLAAVGLFWMGCGQETPAPKPTGTVVQKKIQKPKEAPKPSGPKEPTQPKPQGARDQARAVQAAEGSKPGAEQAPLEKQVVYHYEPGDRPDPFRPFHEEAKAALPPTQCEAVGPLTELEVNQFTLVALVGQGGERTAMVQDKTGKGYIVRPGLYMGRKCGKVVEISPSEGVVVEETYLDLLGHQQTRRVTLGFKKSQGGGR